MKKIVLKNESCIGCGACVGIDPEHFEFSDEGYSVIKSQENLDSSVLTDAIEACPVAIISLVDEKEQSDSKTQECPSNKPDCHCQEENCECDHSDCHCESKEINDMDEAA